MTINDLLKVIEDHTLLTLTQEDTLSLDAGQAELEITCNFKGAGNIIKPKKNPKIKVLDCTDEEIME